MDNIVMDKKESKYIYERFLRAKNWDHTIEKITTKRKELGHGGDDDKVLEGFLKWRGDGVIKVEWRCGHEKWVFGELKDILILYEDAIKLVIDYPDFEIETNPRIEELKIENVYFCINYQFSDKENEFLNGVVFECKKDSCKKD